jgi:hypothetical protein
VPGGGLSHEGLIARIKGADLYVYRLG